MTDSPLNVTDSTQLNQTPIEPIQTPVVTDEIVTPDQPVVSESVFAPIPPTDTEPVTAPTEKALDQSETVAKQPMIIKASKLSNYALRTFVTEYLKGNNNDYKDTLEQIQTIDELIEKDELTEEELINNPISL